ESGVRIYKLVLLLICNGLIDSLLVRSRRGTLNLLECSKKSGFGIETHLITDRFERKMLFCGDHLTGFGDPPLVDVRREILAQVVVQQCRKLMAGNLYLP